MISIFRRLSWLMRRRTKEAELQEELQFHMDEEAEQRQEGVTPEDAQRAARRDLGNVALVKESTREVWGWTWLEQFGQDLRYAMRTMASNKLFALLTVTSLALGIGANTAIYSFMDALLFRSLPVDDPQSLVVLNWRMRVPDANRGAKSARSVMHSANGNTYSDPDTGWTGGIFPYPAFELLRKSESVFSSVFGWLPAADLNVVIGGRADVAAGVYVTGDYFGGLGVIPAAGRPIVADDDKAGAPAVALVSYGYSQRRFGNPSDAVGQRILINNVPVTIVGVAPAEFFGVDPSAAPDFYLPLHTNLVLDSDPSIAIAKSYLDQGYYWICMMARLRTGVGLAEAQSAVSPTFHQWVQSTAQNDDELGNLPALLLVEGGAGADTLRRRYAKPLYVLMTLVGMILAVACANIANLLLARGSARSREIALRLSVGAGRGRVVRQLLTESVALASLGGILAILVATWGIRFLTLLLGNNPAIVPPRANLNWHVLVVAAVLSLLTGLLFGLAPAIRSTRMDVLPALKAVRAGRAPARVSFGLSDMLVVFQISLSLLMLVAAGLFARTLWNYQSLGLGFNPENILLFQVNARQAGHQGLEMATFYDGLRNRFGAIPGVRDVSLAHRSLFRAGFSLPIVVSGSRVDGNILLVGPRYFSTMQIPMLLGREIDERDRPGSADVAVISELFAKTVFGNENPIGRRLTIGGTDRRELEVVGVSKDARYGGLGRKIPSVLFVPYDQGSHTFIDRMVYVIRTDGDPLAYVNAVREVVHEMDARLPVANTLTQAKQIDQTLNREIMFARLCTAFAILALVIACVGLYGTVAYNVARRTSEIGIRMALGAQRGRVIRMILQRVMASALAALAIGVPLALVASRHVESFLFGMRGNDPLTLVEAVAILLASATLAAFVPARRASRIDPMVALRHE